MAKMKRSTGKEDVENSAGSKRRRKLSFSEDELTGSEFRTKHSDSPPLSKIYNSSCRNNKPAELFRKDLISAMKLPDNEPLDPDDFWCVTDTWKQEWERGVQVPVNSKNVPLPKITEKERDFKVDNFKLPKKLIRLSQDDFYSSDIHSLSNVMTDTEKVCRYDMDDLDSCWLEVFNEERQNVGLPAVDENTVELAMENFEAQCFNKFQEAFQTEEGLGIEYDEDVICDVCRTPECEEGNEMVFCDVCNICVHQACYGITAIPEGSWVCRTCASNVQPSCILCPNKGGAMKSTRSGDKWAHVSCALWIPEVIIVDAEKMEPITKISQIPPSRWSLICTLCRERVGACIQCCVKQCKVAYHVTCAFEHGLEMKGIVDESKEDDGVRLKSYCLKHSNNNKEVLSASEGVVWKIKNVIKKEGKPTHKVSDLDKQNARLQKIRTMEAEFYKYVNIAETKKVHNIDPDVMDIIYNYWKLKRTANFNKPLIPTKMDESALLGKHPEDSLYARMKMFVHLRQDLERVRNLCYMVSRREKFRRSFFKTKEEIFLKIVEALKCKSMKRNGKDFDSVLQASTGNSIYDQMYSRKNYVALENPAPLKDIEDDGSKNKLGSTARLPNPYAKRYLNGIHTRTRRHTTTTEQAETDDNYGLKDSDRSKSADHLATSSDTLENENSEVTNTMKSTENTVKNDINVKNSDCEPSEVEANSESLSKDIENAVDNCTKTSDCSHLAKESVIDKPTEFEDRKVDDSTKEEDALIDVKNSPSQSDKENMVSNLKIRGKKAKNQIDLKSSDLSKAIENLSIKTEVETSPTDCFKLKDNNMKTEIKLEGNRYPMRSRHRSTSESQQDLNTSFSEKPLPSPTETTEICSKPSSAIDSRQSDSDHLPDIRKDKVECCTDDAEKDAKLIPKVKLKQKRQVKRKLFTRTKSRYKSQSQVKTHKLDDCESSEEEVDDDFVQENDNTQALTFSSNSEFKMTLRQGKILLSPRKLALRNSEKLLTFSGDLRNRSFSPLADESSIESLKSEKIETVDSDNPNSTLGNAETAKQTPSQDRDVTASPRLVLRLKKDPERQRWQKESTSFDSVLFKVVRNDWEDVVHDKTDKDDVAEWEQLLNFEQNYSGHRYMMRSRSKQTLNPS